MKKSADTNYKIHDLLKERWSPRAFSSRTVEREKLLSLFEAARWSPSAANQQPWYFVVFNQENSEKYQQLIATLTGKNPVWAKSAPFLVVAVAKVNPDQPGANKYAYYDLGQAVAHLSVQASDLGLQIHQMGGFEGDKVRRLAEVPEGYEPVTVFALGYLGRLEDLPQDLREREIAARSRKGLDEFVYAESWQRPITPYIQPDFTGFDLPLAGD